MRAAEGGQGAAVSSSTVPAGEAALSSDLLLLLLLLRLLRLHHVQYCSASTHQGPASTPYPDPSVFQGRPLHHAGRSNRHWCGLPEQLSPGTPHPHLSDRVGGLHPGPGAAVLPAVLPSGQRRAHQPPQSGLHRLELSDHLVPVLLVRSRERVDLLHLQAQLRQDRRGSVLRQDAVPVCVLDHHLGLHPAGFLLCWWLLCPGLFLPAGSSRSRRHVESISG